jgi:hypothetical protein
VLSNGVTCHVRPEVESVQAVAGAGAVLLLLDLPQARAHASRMKVNKRIGTQLQRFMGRLHFRWSSFFKRRPFVTNLDGKIYGDAASPDF